MEGDCVCRRKLLAETEEQEGSPEGVSFVDQHGEYPWSSYGQRSLADYSP